MLLLFELNFSSFSTVEMNASDISKNTIDGISLFFPFRQSFTEQLQLEGIYFFIEDLSRNENL